MARRLEVARRLVEAPRPERVQALARRRWYRHRHGDGGGTGVFKINSVSVSDFVDQDRTRVVYPAEATVGSNILSLALEDGVVIDRSNLKNLVDGDSTTGSAPKLVLALDEVPAAGATGSMMVR